MINQTPLRRRASIRLAILTLAVTIASACAPAPSATLTGDLLVDRASSPAHHAAQQLRATRPADAAVLDDLATTPTAKWIGDWHSDPGAAVRDYLAKGPGVGQLVLYAIPFRDCGSHSAGGVNEATYPGFVRSMAAGIGDREVIVIIEPDAVALDDCLSATQRAQRKALIAEAVRILEAQPNVHTYIDAGHSNWHSAAVISARLRESGIAQADGFALNVSNHRPIAELIGYGEQVSVATGGKRFVIDTSRNGANLTTSEWCNTPGRRVGAKPTLSTGHQLVAAFLWVKVPGESDGACNGWPNAGQFSIDGALRLARG